MKTISRIAYSNDKRNRTRSILIMMSICLTTMLLVIISTVGNGMIRLQKSQAAGSYGSNYGLFVTADASQLKEVSRRAEIDAIGIMCTEGIIKGNENGGFVCMDETARKMLPYNKEYELKEGKYPEKMQEIAAGRAFFRAMGYGDVKIGDTVTLDYRAGMRSEYKPEEFVVSGILYDRDEYTIEASYVAFGSQEFYDEHVAENDRQYNIYFTLNDSANVSMNNIDSVIKQIAAACGIEEKNVIVNDLYLQWVLQPSYETIAVCGILILAIVLFSVGLLLGFLIAKCGFNWLVEQGNLVSTGTGSMGVQNQQVPLFSLPVILLCIFVSFLTVALALRKPMKIVSRISPIEATRYLENAETHKKGKRNGRKNVTVFSMAMANITGNPKRTIGTILTLGLSCALFVIISNYVGNIDTEHEARLSVNHGQFELQLDYSVEYDERYPENNLDTILTDNPLNDSLIEEIKSIPGVTDVMTREIVSVNLNGTRFPVAIVSKNDFDFMRQDGDIGSMDYDQAVKNGEIFFGWSMWMEQDGYAPGESIAFDFENGSGTYTYQGKIAGSFVSADTYLVIPEGVYRSMNPRGTAYGYLWVDCDKKDVASVEQSLNTLISNTSHIKMDTYHAQLQSAEFAARMMKLGCYLFMAVVGLIGFMNMANTMMMNITTKKQEYGVLQAVGMTNKQLNLCLQLQGLIFTVGTICVALIIGLPLGYTLFSYAKHNGIFGMNIYHVPIVPIFIMIFLVGLLQIVLSCVLSSNLKKETLVERIRYQG